MNSPLEAILNIEGNTQNLQSDDNEDESREKDCQCIAGSNIGKNPTLDKEHTGNARTFILNSLDNDYRIDCCGFLSSWTFYVGTTTGTLYAQVWRPEGTDWKLIGQNTITVLDSDKNALKTEAIDSSSQIPVLSRDFIGFKSSNGTIPMFRKTNMGNSGNEDVLYTDSEAYIVNSVVTGATFTTYTEKNIEFSILADLVPGKPPSFGASPTSSSVTDDTPVGTVLATLTATDADALDTLNLTWTGTTPPANAGVFSYNENTGDLTTTGQLPIGDTDLTFSATDLCGNTATHAFKLTVTNYPPVFQNLPDTTTISEDIDVETQLKILTVTDASLADTITCAINNINPPLGDLYLRYAPGTSNYAVYLRANAALDYDTTRQYDIGIDCNDTKITVSETFTVFITRNQQPTITNLPTGSNSIEIPGSTTAIGTNIFTVTSTDPENDQLYYNMTCTPACPFKVLDSGTILVASSLATLTETAYDLFIYVYDGNTLVGPRSLTVKISDVNTAPNITNLPSSIVVAENTAQSTTLYTLEKSDVNSLDSHTWTYSISSNGSTYFIVDSSGLVKTTSTIINYETITPKTFYLTAYVSDGKAVASGTLTIVISNLNEAPYFSRSTYSVTGNEGDAGDSIGTPAFAVTDPEGDTVTYTQDCPQFTMNPSSGALTFTSLYDIDSGLPATVTCTVTASDGSLTDTATLIVNINNINDNDPTFASSAYSFFVSPTSSVGTVIAALPATDGDIGSFGEITYTIDQTSTGGTYFGMKSNGELFVASDLSPFAAGDTKAIIITATDDGGKTDTLTVTIVIPGITTVEVSNTTDRYMTFFEDTRNVAWFVVAMAVVAGLLTLIMTFIVRYGDFSWIPRSCEKLAKKCKRKRRIKMKREPTKMSYVEPSRFRTPTSFTTWDAWKMNDHTFT
ncbi:cadherin-related family member 2-like [Saccostrea cucullata]|uniref:cadherin-related family member 2-like n=1 Tax=Saccostrea cuccullata TaxID=36930 RepID=UPI002ED139FB